jgi:uncharacterized protein YegL
MGFKRAGMSKLKFLNLGGKNEKILSALLTLILILLSSFNFLNTPGIITGSTIDNTARTQNVQGTEPKIEYLEIETVIDNNYATTNIHEKFKNSYNNSINKTYYFQIPAKAFISNFSLTINNKTHFAEVVPKAVGQQKFNESIKKGINAGLVEAKDKNIFSYSISLSPNEETIIGLRYEQFIEKSLVGYRYMIPLKGSFVGSNINRFSINITLKFKLSITDADVDNHYSDANVSSVFANIAKVTYQANITTPNEDFVLNYQLATPPVNGTMLNYHDGTTEFFFHIFSPQRSELGDYMAKEIIFVLDKSGSMCGNKISQLKTAFKEIVNQLHTNDTFNIITFDSYITNYKTGLIGASSVNKSQAVSFINEIQASGSTNINDAMETALDMFIISETKMPIIVMLTDGLPTSGETETKYIRENVKNKNTANVSIFCLGFGYDVDFEFLKAMSLENFGFAIRIYENENALYQMTDFYDKISTPLLRRLNFSYSAGAYEFYPKTVEQLFEGTEIVVVGKYNGSSRNITSTVNATSSKGMKKFEETFDLDSSNNISFTSQLIDNEKCNDNTNNSVHTPNGIPCEMKKANTGILKLKYCTNYAFIPRFWAYSKIRHLLDELVVKGNNISLVENVTKLALAYSFVTPYTSLLIEVLEPNNDAGSGSEGESESECEAESEAEGEAEGETEDGGEPKAKGENEPETDPEMNWKTYNDLGDVIEHPKGESNFNELSSNELRVNKKEAELDVEGESEAEPENEPEIEIEQDGYNLVTISITNNIMDPIKVYWLGIHFDWHSENHYYICTDISKENSVSIGPGVTKYFYILIKIPSNVRLGYHSCYIVFQYELQDGWFGQWNDYYWQSEDKTDFEVKQRDINNAEEDLVIVVVPEPKDDGTFNPPQPLIPSESISEPSTTADNDGNEDDLISPILPDSKNNGKLHEDSSLIDQELEPLNEIDFPLGDGNVDDTQKEEISVDDKDNSDTPFNSEYLILVILVILIAPIIFIFVKRRRYRTHKKN